MIKSEKPERQQAFADFELAIEALTLAREKSKEQTSRAQELEAEAAELREAATKEVERALLGYACAHRQLRKVSDLLDTWDTERAQKLLKAADTVRAIEKVEATA